MSYRARCLLCGCLIWMEDDFDEADLRACEECLTDFHTPKDIYGHPI